MELKEFLEEVFLMANNKILKEDVARDSGNWIDGYNSGYRQGGSRGWKKGSLFGFILCCLIVAVIIMALIDNYNLTPVPQQKGITLGENDVCIENKTEYSAELVWLELMLEEDYQALNKSIVEDAIGWQDYYESNRWVYKVYYKYPLSKVIEHTYCVAKEHKDITRWEA